MMRKRHILISAIILLCLVCIAFLYRNYQLHIAWERLVKYPEPLPTYILGLTPYPGTRYPIDERSKIYWIDWDAAEEFSRGSVVCADINAQVINPLVSLSVESSELLTMVPKSSVDLYLNGLSIKMFDMHAESDQFVTSLIIFPPYVDILYCWKMSLAPGDYLATLIIHPVDGEDLRYQWAFSVVDDD